MPLDKNSLAIAANLPHPDSVTGSQIDNLLRIIGTLSMFLSNPRHEVETIPGKNAPPREVAESAEVTFMLVCSRLDDIVGDASRWNMDFQKQLEARAAAMQQHNVEFLRAQTQASQEIITPHFRYRPNIKKLPNGMGWIVFLGDVDNYPEQSIAGIGGNPAEAVKAFDDVFQGTLPLQMLEWLAKHEQALSEGQTPPPFPITKIQNTNEQSQQSVDSRTNRKARKSKSRRRDDQSDSGKAGPVL